MKEKLPKVLLIGISPWNKHEGTDTLQNIFSCWEKDKIAQIYTRSGNPCSDVCDSFFKISENQLIKSIFNRKQVGERVINNTSNLDNNDYKKENERYKKAHKKKSWLMSFIREFVWGFGKWKSKKLDEFITEEDPDILFIPIYPVIYMAKLQEYVIKKTCKPYVCYLADDNYTYKSCGKSPLELLYRFILRKHVKKLAINCQQMYTITQIEGNETDRFFGTKSLVLTKSIDFKENDYCEKNIHNPISIVYTGNMLIGRDSSIMDIADAVRYINRDRQKLIFHIYSHTPPNTKILNRIVSNDVIFHGEVKKEDIKKIQNDADILLFVESLKKENRYKARMSFSTKLVDYFSAGKCIFAVGDKDIAPIIYLKQNDAAIVACSHEDILAQLQAIISDINLIKIYSKKSFECGKRNHNKIDIEKRFVESMIMTTRKEKT